MTYTPALPLPTDTVRAVTFDLYRDIHKGIRAELFAVTLESASLDPSDHADRAGLASHLANVSALLASHAEHEDAAIDPALELHLPSLAERINADHHELEARIGRVLDMAQVAVTATDDLRHRVHQVNLEMAAFTSAYLIHQDVEERVVMPALEAAIGVEAVIAIHGAIIGSIPPPEMMQTLAVMLPAMNVDDRTDLLGGMRASAPPEAFDAVVSLTRSVLCPVDATAVLSRLGLS
jgi:hypothetical protein